MKKIVSLLLCAGLCVGLLTCFAAGNAYEEAVAELRSPAYGSYLHEATYDGPLCTLFSYSIGAPHGPYAHLDLVYKAGSPLGEGTVVSLPVPSMNFWGASSAPETLDWDPESGQLTYSYYFVHPIHGADIISSIRQAEGTFLYTVDLTTGEVTEVLTPPTYEDILERHLPESSYAREQILEAPGTTVLLLRQKAGDGGYSLLLVDRAETSDHRVRDLILPSTIVLDAYPNWFPTDRAPDRLSLSEDGNTLTYVYSFPDKLASPYDGAILHEAGTYTYTVDISTGELEVEHTPPIPVQGGKFSDVPAGSWFETGVATCAEKGVMVGTSGDAFSPERDLSQAECLTLAFRLYALQHGGDETLETAPEDWGQLTLTLADGTVFQGYGYQDPFGWWSWPKNDVRGGYARVPGEYSPDGAEQQAWIDAHPEAVASDAPASLTLNGETYQGTIWCWMPVGSYVLMFQPEEGMSSAVNDRISHALMREAGPDKWWRNVSYTIVQRGLEDIFDPAEFSDHPATRGFFAQLIADACEGHLDQINTVTAIPDLSRENDGTTADDYREAAYTLYEAEILTGVDSAGTFAADATLTRAEAAVMVARALDETQRVTTLAQDSTSQTAEPLSTEKFDSYDQAAAALRDSWEYRNEQTFEAPDCTIFVYDPGGIMHRSYGSIRLIYKPGSQVGEGTVIALPHARVQYTVVGRPADTMALSEDGKTFTYTYYRPEDIVGNIPGENEGEVLEKAGCVTYTVDLSTGSITERFDPPNYESALAHVSRKRIITPGQHSEDREVVQTLEAPDCTAVLTKGRYGDEYDDYILSLVYKPGSALGDGTIKRLLLPTTAVVSASSAYNPTHRAPDSLFLSAGGTKLVYAYDFTDQLTSGETVYHEAGRYTYTVELKTGELSVDAPFKPDNIGVTYGSYQQAMDGLKNGQYPLSVDRQLETESCSLFMGHVSAPHGGYYALKLVFKAGSQPGDGMVVNLPQPRINFWDNGSVPDRLEISEDQQFLTYTYHFDEPFQFDGGILHEAGDYTYTVDLRTGVVAEELLPGDYGEVLDRCLQDEGYTVEQTLEGTFCTALLRVLPCGRERPGPPAGGAEGL